MVQDAWSRARLLAVWVQRKDLLKNLHRKNTHNLHLHWEVGIKSGSGFKPWQQTVAGCCSELEEMEGWMVNRQSSAASNREIIWGIYWNLTNLFYLTLVLLKKKEKHKTKHKNKQNKPNNKKTPTYKYTKKPQRQRQNPPFFAKILKIKIYLVRDKLEIFYAHTVKVQKTCKQLVTALHCRRFLAILALGIANCVTCNMPFWQWHRLSVHKKVKIVLKIAQRIREKYGWQTVSNMYKRFPQRRMSWTIHIETANILAF